MKDVLLPIGTIVSVTIEEYEGECMIIGKRVISPHSFKHWDYVSVPIGVGFEWDIKKDESDKFKFHSNLFYFNHYEISKIINLKGQE